MKKMIQSALLLAAIFIPAFAQASPLTAGSLDKLLALSGLKKQIAQYPGLVRAGLEQARQEGASMPDAEFQELRNLTENAFRPSAILDTVGMEIKKNISESEAKDLFVWYESDLGKMFTRAEENASTPSAYQEMLKQAQVLFSDQSRVKLARRLDSLLNVTDVTLQLEENTTLAVFAVFATVAKPDQPVNIEALRAQLSAQEQQRRANAEQLVILSFLYAYKDINPADMEKYLKFLERPNTRKFNDSVMKGIKHGFNQSLEKMAKSLAILLKKKDGSVDKKPSQQIRLQEPRLGELPAQSAG